MRTVSSRAAYIFFIQTLYRFNKELFPHTNSRQISDYVIKWCKHYE